MSESNARAAQAPPQRLNDARGLDDARGEDALLMEAAARGEYEAFEQLARRYHERVYRLAFGMTKSASDAEEVVQETFLNVFRHLGSFKRESAPGSWIYRIAVNAALMRLRTRRRKPLLSLDDPGTPSGQVGADEPFWSASGWARQPDEALMSSELGSQVEQAMDKLPEKYRLVLLLRDVEGHSNEEVAHSLGLTVPTVKSRLHRARLFMRQELELYFQRK